MAEQCPAPEALQAFAAGTLSPPGCDAVEAHVMRCESCAKELDRVTREQLDEMVEDARKVESSRAAACGALDRLMRQARSTAGVAARFDWDAVRQKLDPPVAEGALGSLAGYDILEIAGSGGMGGVFKARDRTLDRVVALKVFAPAGGSDDLSTARFLEEARAIAAIQHDHITPVHQAGVVNGLPYLVMPYFAEGTLARRLEQTPRLTPAEAAGVALQLARALEATHARGILHRDLKPSNVLLELGLDRVRLADFGLAQSVPVLPLRQEDRESSPAPPLRPAGSTSQPTKSGRRLVAGTPHYMAPEQARGEPIDARSDLFGLGAVLYQLATGQTLYPGESSTLVLQAARQGEFKPVREVAPEVPAALAVIIDRLLARRAEDRFASAAEAAEGLERFVNAKGRGWLRAKQAAVGALAAAVALGAAIALLDWTGTTAVFNTLLCRRTGDGYFIRGRFGTYARLPEAVAAARPHDVLEARFSDEQLIEDFRVGGKPLTIRAANGFTPVLLATNNAQPLILADAPLTLEGLTLWRRGPVVNFAALISVENAPLHLLNCRLIRSRFQGQDVMVQGRLRVSHMVDSQRYRALLAFQHGSTGHLRNCVVAGIQTSAIELRSSANQPTHVDIDNSLVFIDRGIYVNRQAETGVSLQSTRSVFVTGVLLDISRPPSLQGMTASWHDCILDRTQGALVRLGPNGSSERLPLVDWKEANVVYAGQGSFVAARGRQAIASEAEWNELMRLSTNSHRFIDQQAFPETCVRSSLALSADDLDPKVVRNAPDGMKDFGPQFIGEGESYAAFRKTRAYREWQKQVRASVREWEQHRTAGNPR